MKFNQWHEMHVGGTKADIFDRDQLPHSSNLPMETTKKEGGKSL